MKPVFTIWGAGGHDTLDLSGFASPSRLDLHAGAFSDTGQMTNNISIAFGARIEDAIGGSGNDVLIANETQKRLSGGGGGHIFTFTDRDAQIGWMRSDGKKALPDTIADFASGQDRIDLTPIDTGQRRLQLDRRCGLLEPGRPASRSECRGPDPDRGRYRRQRRRQFDDHGGGASDPGQ